MNRKIIYIGIVIVLLVAVGIFLNAKINSKVIAQTNLGEYRSKEIPEECRLPAYQNDIEAWKQHLSHHQQTWYCFEKYYGENIENFLKGGN